MKEPFLGALVHIFIHSLHLAYTVHSFLVRELSADYWRWMDVETNHLSKYAQLQYGSILSLWQHNSHETTCIRWWMSRSIALQVVNEGIVVGGAYFEDY